mgnify:CR=1 FL=1
MKKGEKIIFSLEDTVMEKREDNKVERGKSTALKTQAEKSSKERGSEWRKKERPIQKTIHFDEAMHRKINILKQIEGKAIQDLVLVPKIMGNVTGMGPAMILLSLSVWGALLGVVGMIIALPLTTLLVSYYKRFVLKIEDRPKTTKEKRKWVFWKKGQK